MDEDKNAAHTPDGYRSHAHWKRLTDLLPDGAGPLLRDDKTGKDLTADDCRKLPRADLTRVLVRLGILAAAAEVILHDPVASIEEG